MQKPLTKKEIRKNTNISKEKWAEEGTGNLQNDLQKAS